MHRLLALVVVVGCGGAAPAPVAPVAPSPPPPAQPVTVAATDPCDGGETQADPCAGGEAAEQVAIADPCDGGEASGGLGLRGTGEGGGGVGGGSSLGKVGTLGTGSGSGSGYGSGGGGAPGGGGPIGRRGPAYLPTVKFGKATISGTYSAAVLTRGLKRYTAQTRYCYERQLNANPTLGGTVMLELTLTPEGGVAHAKATGLAPDLESCLGGAAIRWTFPKPSKGIVKISVPITYAPSKGT